MATANPNRLTAYRFDTPDALGDLATNIWKAHIRIRTFSCTVIRGLVKVQLSVDKPELAHEILLGLGWHLNSARLFSSLPRKGLGRGSGQPTWQSGNTPTGLQGETRVQS